MQLYVSIIISEDYDVYVKCIEAPNDNEAVLTHGNDLGLLLPDTTAYTVYDVLENNGYIGRAFIPECGYMLNL